MPPWLDAITDLVLITSLALGAAFWFRADKRNARNVARLQVSLDSARNAAQSAELDARVYRALASRSQIAPATLLSGLTADGAPLSLDLGSLRQPTVLYSIDPTCVACTANLPFVDSLDSLASSGDGPGCTVDAIGVLVASESEVRLLPEFRGMQLLIGASGVAWDAVSMEQAPLLMLLKPPGHVVGSWNGVLSVSDRQKIVASLLAACNESHTSGTPASPPS